MLAREWTRLCHELASDLAGLQVGVYASGGAPFHHLALATLWGADAWPIRAEDIHEGALETLDVLVFPGGGFTAMAGMLAPLGVEGARQVRAWVEAGGLYLGSCAGSFLAAHVGEPYWQAHEEARALHMVDAALANSSDSIFEGLSSPGVGILRAKLTEQNHWLAEGLPETFEIVHYNGPLFELRRSATSALDDPTGVLRPIYATAGFTPSEGFMGEPPEETLLTRCIGRTAFNGIETGFGKGHVVLFGSHPEFGFDVLQLGWREAVKLLANALRFQAARRKSATSEAAVNTISAISFEESSQRLEAIARQFGALHRADTNGWLDGVVPSFLGRGASTIWLEASARAAEVARATAHLTNELAETEAKVASFWLDSAPLTNQDVGFTGLKQLLDSIESRLGLALSQLGAEPVKLEHAYDGFETHPYQIAVSSYLSAAGLTAAAHLLCVTIAKASQNDALIPLDFLVA